MNSFTTCFPKTSNKPVLKNAGYSFRKEKVAEPKGVFYSDEFVISSNT